MLRVLHFAGTINRYDFIDTVIRFADPRRFRMMACTFTAQSNIEDPGYERDGIPHFVLGVRRSKTNFPRAIARLTTLLRRERVDILHTHHYDEALIGLVAARLAGTPAVVVGRHYHDEIYLLTNGFKRKALLALEGWVNRRAKAIVVPSTPIRSLLVERQRVPADKVHVIPYGFDFRADRYRPPTQEEVERIREELGLQGYFVVGNFARHHRLKGQEYLLHAFARFVQDEPSARLLMVGDGPDHGRLRALARELGLEETGRVLFTGWRKDARRLMGAVDVVVHPTLLDSFPQVMVEAMALGKPLITTPAAGPMDQVRPGRTGLMVPMRDVEALYGALVWVRTHGEEARAMGERARAYVQAELDIRSVIPRYEAVYEACGWGRK
jgi:glycosyltransferase involved in cell wall biosynthesis